MDAALELVSAFHVNDIGLHEQWLGCGLLLEWTAHADYPTGALTVELVENITRYQADGGDPEAVQALEAKQRAVLAGLLSFKTSLWNSTLKPNFCASEHAKTSTKMRSASCWSCCLQWCAISRSFQCRKMSNKRLMAGSKT